jgi:hypothetical protein
MKALRLWPAAKNERAKGIIMTAGADGDLWKACIIINYRRLASIVQYTLYNFKTRWFGFAFASSEHGQHATSRHVNNQNIIVCLQD